MLQDNASESFSSSSSPGSKKKGKGGRKKNLHPPTPVIMKHRRNMANARERKRMNGLNDAFERLREVVPNVNTEQVRVSSFSSYSSSLLFDSPSSSSSYVSLLSCFQFYSSRRCRR